MAVIDNGVEIEFSQEKNSAVWCASWDEITIVSIHVMTHHNNDDESAELSHE